MKNINLYIRKIKLVITMSFMTLTSFPQQAPKPCGNPGNPCEPAMPIDDYIPLLIIAAIILGLWAINKHKKQSAITE